MSASPLPELPAIGFLSEVPAEHRAFLTSFGKFLRPSNGDVLIEQGTHQDTLNLILEGTLHVVSTTDDRPVLLATLGSGESFGEINLFDPSSASATVISRSESLVWSLTRDELDALTDADPVAALFATKGILRQLSKRIRVMNEKLAASERKSDFHHFWTSGTP